MHQPDEMRPGWDETMMTMAETLAERSTCIFYAVGCFMLTRKKVIAASGYNGPPRDFPHCIEVGCNKTIKNGGRCLGAHAELNAISFCAGSPHQELDGGTLYITLLPCNQCMKSIVQVGIKRIVFRDYYLKRGMGGKISDSEKPEDALEVAKIARIQVEKYDPKTKTTVVILEGNKPVKVKKNRRE
jgi:dCMP deaminase